LDNSPNRRVVEALVTRAYFQLILVSWGADGSRSASLAVHGNHEVRLIERRPAESGGGPQMWIDLFQRDTGASIEMRACRDDLEAAVTAAEHLIARAMQLDAAARSKE
jgi:hypothetical protein